MAPSARRADLPIAALPRFLRVWIVANSLAYLVISVTGLLAPEHHKTVMNAAMPVLFGEMALMLWLLIAGARVRSSPLAA